ncbi:ribonuclease-like [Emydura macquarii macquarii]|uniref:ribonuclease-like n=1 Tax=Emydura macquarii macquarii TaxID=1129001 RepID=UPI00352BA455
MAPRGPRPTLLLTLGLLAACLALASGQAWAELHKIFLKHHVDYPRPSPPFIGSYCDFVMRERGLYGTQVNTFIHEPSQSINSICLGNGTPLGGGLYQSKAFIPITTCRYRRQTGSYPNDEFDSRKIVIGCWNRLAVYFRE